MVATVTRRLVFTDLDGTLLDHDSYSYAPAADMLGILAAREIPLVPATSKTRAELGPLREELENRHPFIVENGAAVFVPADYFAAMPDGAVDWGENWVFEIGQPRQHWLALLAELESIFSGEFQYFHRAGTEGIAAMTGLPPEAAALANQRDYSEPVKWLGQESRKQDFIEALESRGASVTPGGRFLSVSGHADKGQALVWLRAAFRQAWGDIGIEDLAAGDSPNDRAMLEQAGTALVVRSRHHRYPRLARTGPTIYSRRYGPEGWAEGIARWLDLDSSQN